jgi:ABC-2 type transport system permease protein
MKALLGQSFGALTANRALFLSMSGTMFLNDVLFFMLWVVFFSGVPSVDGWTLADVAMLQGIVVTGFGTAFFLAGGSNKLGRRVLSGELDTYLARPRHPLGQLMTLECDASTLGDALYGVLLLVTFAHLRGIDLILSLVLAAAIAALFLAIVVILQSLAFFVRGGSALGDQLFEMVLCVGFIPQHTQGLAMKIVLFTILPAGFMTIVPVEIVRHHSLTLLAGLMAAVAVYLWIAVRVFQAGLRRYTSATGWTA